MQTSFTDPHHASLFPGALLVLGMHRSGTSAVARLLAGVGLDFGPRSAQIPANDENPLGFFEHKKLVRANQLLLVGERAPWLQAIDYGSVGFDCAAVAARTRAHFEAEARALLQAFDGSAPVGLKDPRLCLTLPCWRPLLGDPVCIHVVRHPVDVACSLERRGNVPLPVGIAMWEHYNLRILEHTKNLPVLRLRFESLMSQDETVMDTLLTFLHAHGMVGRHPAASAVSDGLGSVDTTLVHHRNGPNQADELLSPAQSGLLEQLLSNTPTAPLPAPPLSIGSKQVLLMHERAHPIDDHTHEAKERAARWARLARKRRMHFKRLRKDIDSLHEALRVTRERQHEERQRLRASLNQRVKAEQMRAERVLADAEAERKQLEHRIDRLLADFDAVFASFSWRSGRRLKNLILAVKGGREGSTAENHVLRIAEEHSDWKSARPQRAEAFPSRSIAAFAASWMRLYGQTRAMVGVIVDQGRTRFEHPLDPSVYRLPKALADSNGLAVIPLGLAELPEAPADVLIVATSTIGDRADLARLAAFATARQIPVVCLADGIADLQRKPIDPEAGDPDSAHPAFGLLQLADAIVASSLAVTRSLQRFHGKLVPWRFNIDTATPGAGSSPAPGLSALTELLTGLVARSSVPRAWATFEWPRLPLSREDEFDEASYLSQQPDVAVAIAEGILTSAREHWDRHGREEALCGDRWYVPGWTLSADNGGWHLAPGLHAKLCSEISTWPRKPKISILMPAWNSDPEWLEAAISSLTTQTYSNWELCIADDGSTRRDTISTLARLSDPRIVVRRLDANQGIAAASNAALEMATGDYVALLDHDDTLAQDALYLVACCILRTDPDLIYSDEDKLALDGSHVEPCHKPRFSPDLLLSQNYISHLGVYRRSVLMQIGGFRQGYDGAQDYDLVLRFATHASRIEHLPYCLYHWRKVPGSTADRFDAKDYAWEAGQRALEDHLRQREIAGTVQLGRYPGTYTVRRRISGTPRVAIIIPFRDQPALLEACIDSILDKTEYPFFEILGVSNESSDPRTYALMDALSLRDPRIRFIRHDIPFNYSAINNHAVSHVGTDHLLFLNNDIEVLSPEWLSALLEHSQRPEVGCVGARLLYPDRTIQHAGVGIGMLTLAGHMHRHLSDQEPGYFARPWQIQNVSAVTGACLMMRRKVFEDVQGFDAENLPVAFNDIDLCLRVREAGYLNIYTPVCTLLHHESKTRGLDDTPEKRERFGAEVRYMQQRHARILSEGDPYLNPNLSLYTEHFQVTTAIGVPSP